MEDQKELKILIWVKKLFIIKAKKSNPPLQHNKAPKVYLHPCMLWISWKHVYVLFSILEIVFVAVHGYEIEENASWIGFDAF